MGYYDIKGLFRKLSQGTISEEELTFLNKWMDSNQVDGLSKLIDKDWSTFNDTEELKEAPRWMTDTETKPTPRLFIHWKRRWAIAASILVLLVSGVALLFLNRNQPPRLVQKINTTQRKQFIELPDGSEVWLKRNSTLSYWKPFKGQERIFNLDGEAFFDVTPDSTRPFIVYSDYLATKVLGTSFNIISGNEALMPEVALVEGAVEVSLSPNATSTKSVILKPGEKVQVDAINNKIIPSSFEEDQPYAWKDDVMFFQKADVQEVARILEGWYNIEFTVDTDTSGALVHRYDTKKLKIEEVLNGISSVMPYTFQRQKNGSYVIKAK